MRSRLLTAAVAASLALTLAPAAANAEPAPLTGVELNKSVSQSVAVDATFDYNAAVNIGLPALKQLRGEMWDINPYFNNNKTAGTTRLQDVARQHGLTTKSAYVNAVSIDAGLTRISIQRAAEQVGGLSHDRPDGTSPWTAKIGPHQSWGESLGGGLDLRSSILEGWGRGELDALNKARGGWNVSNGHLHMMINPKNLYYGFGEVKINGSLTYTAAHTSDRSTGLTPMAGGTQRVWLYRAPKWGEAPTGLKSGHPGQASQPKPQPKPQPQPQPQPQPKPKPQPPSNQNPAPAAPGEGGSNLDINTIIGIIFGILGLLGAVAGIAKQLGLI